MVPKVYSRKDPDIQGTGMRATVIYLVMRLYVVDNLFVFVFVFVFVTKDDDDNI